MHLLPPTRHQEAAPLLAELGRHHLVVESVLNHHTRGRVYVDDRQAPQIALLWTLMDTVLLAGDLSQLDRPALRRLILSEMGPDAARRHIPFFTIVTAQPQWLESLPELLREQRLETITRCAFSLPPDVVPAVPPCPPGFALRPLDAELLSKTDLRHSGGPRGWVRSFWEDERDFVRQGVGFALLSEDAVASWALSVYAGDSALELGVETAGEYRGRGLATIAAAACLRACARRAITPHWQCDAANAPSYRLALRLGFVEARRFQAIRLWLEPEKLPA